MEYHRHIITFSVITKAQKHEIKPIADSINRIRLFVGNMTSRQIFEYKFNLTYPCKFESPYLIYNKKRYELHTHLTT